MKEKAILGNCFAYFGGFEKCSRFGYVFPFKKNWCFPGVDVKYRLMSHAKFEAGSQYDTNFMKENAILGLFCLYFGISKFFNIWMCFP